MSLVETLYTWARLVRLSHSLLALPFAFSGAVLAAARSGITARQLGWITLAMVGARNAAMGFNRLVDHALDADNPRTATRELPRGAITRQAVWLFTLLLAALFIWSAFELGPLCGLLSPLALAVVFGYSYSKRFTWASHLLLGLGLAMAPVGGWLAVSGHFALEAWLLGAAVLLWVAGFDVVYACQDVAFDRRRGLRSIPARFGTARALTLARMLHAAALATLAVVGWTAQLHPVYWVGWAAIGLLLVGQQRWIGRQDLSRLGGSLFDMNALIGVVYLVTVLAAVTLDWRRVGR